MRRGEIPRFHRKEIKMKDNQIIKLGSSSKKNPSVLSMGSGSSNRNVWKTSSKNEAPVRKMASMKESC